MMTKGKLVEVAPAVPLGKAGGKTYTYRLPEDIEAAPYSRVRVPFGKRTVMGVVLEVHNRRRPYQLKEVDRIFPTQFTAQQLSFAKWITSVSRGSIGLTLRLFFPPRASLTLESHTPREEPMKTQRTQPHYVLSGLLEERLKTVTWLFTSLLAHGGQILIVVPEKHIAHELAVALRQAATVPVWEFTAGLSAKKRTHVWQVVARGETGIVVGTQKALFLPWRDLRAVVVEEDHIHTHKLWDAYPRLDNRVAAPALAALHACPVILSGSIPSVAMTHAIQTDTAVSLPIHWPKLMPRIIASDFNDKVKRLPLPKRGVAAVRAWARDGERVFVLAERRADGAAFGELMKGLARHVSIVHVSAKEPLPSEAKRSKKVELFIGTSAALRQLHNFSLDRVVWLRPERALTYPDFRSHERALTTMSRLQALLPTRRRVVVITRQQQLIEVMLTGDLRELHEQLLLERRAFGYPPFGDMVQLTLQGKPAVTHARLTALRTQLSNDDAIRVFGPYASLDPKKKNLEQHLLLLGQLTDLAERYDGCDVSSVDVAPERIL